MKSFPMSVKNNTNPISFADYLQVSAKSHNAESDSSVSILVTFAVIHSAL